MPARMASRVSRSCTCRRSIGPASAANTGVSCVKVRHSRSSLSGFPHILCAISRHVEHGDTSLGGALLQPYVSLRRREVPFGAQRRWFGGLALGLVGGLLLAAPHVGVD